MRAGTDTHLGPENQEPDFLQIKVTEGTAAFDLRTVDPGWTVEVDTPNAVFRIEHAGYYRVGVSGGRTSFITRRGGHASVISVGGEAVAMAPSEEMVIEGTESPQCAGNPAVSGCRVKPELIPALRNSLIFREDRFRVFL
jgi:hypothetical protein